MRAVPDLAADLGVQVLVAAGRGRTLHHLRRMPSRKLVSFILQLQSLTTSSQADHGCFLQELRHARMAALPLDGASSTSALDSSTYAPAEPIHFAGLWLCDRPDHVSYRPLLEHLARVHPRRDRKCVPCLILLFVECLSLNLVPCSLLSASRASFASQRAPLIATDRPSHAGSAQRARSLESLSLHLWLSRSSRKTCAPASSAKAPMRSVFTICGLCLALRPDLGLDCLSSLPDHRKDPLVNESHPGSLARSSAEGHLGLGS